MPPPNLTPNKFHERSTGASKMQKKLFGGGRGFVTDPTGECTALQQTV